MQRIRARAASVSVHNTEAAPGNEPFSQNVQICATARKYVQCMHLSARLGRAAHDWTAWRERVVFMRLDWEERLRDGAPMETETDMDVCTMCVCGTVWVGTITSIRRQLMD